MWGRVYFQSDRNCLVAKPQMSFMALSATYEDTFLLSLYEVEFFTLVNVTR